MANPSSRIVTRTFSPLLILLRLGYFMFLSNLHDKKRIKHKPLSFIKRIFTRSKSDSDLKTPSPPFSTRNQPDRHDIYPCSSCGEIFRSASVLDEHKTVEHAVTELVEGDLSKNVVRIIFLSGWNNEVKPDPNIIRIIKIHNNSKVLARFEEYRESVKSRAEQNGAVLNGDVRCIVDGNEFLGFHCSTFVCDLGRNGNSAICDNEFCSVCGIIKSGFSAKLDVISMSSGSWRGHLAVPEGIEEEFEFMNLKRAMLVCRVIAGRVGCDPGLGSKEVPVMVMIHLWEGMAGLI